MTALIARGRRINGGFRDWLKNWRMAPVGALSGRPARRHLRQFSAHSRHVRSRYDMRCFPHAPPERDYCLQCRIWAAWLRISPDGPLFDLLER